MEEVPKLLSGIAFKKSMRWRGEAAFSRPVRWLLALHGDRPVPIQWAGQRAGGVTRLLRNSSQPEVSVSSAEEYLAALNRDAIVLDGAARREVIWAGVQAAATAAGGVYAHVHV